MPLLHLLRASSALLLASIALAGCFGIGDGDGGDADGGTGGTTDTGPTGNQTGNMTGTRPTGNATGNMTGGPGANNTTWETENRTGTVESGTAPAVSDPEPANESVQVAAGTQRMVLNVSVMGDPVEVSAYPPGCSEEACAQTGEASEESALSLDFPMPAQGDWTVELVWAGDSLVLGGSSDYSLEIAQQVAKGGNATRPQTNSTYTPYALAW